jgi:hypothetical protein
MKPETREARVALTRLGRPERDQRRDTLSWGMYYLWAALSDPTKRRDYLAKLLRPGGTKALRAFHARRRNLMR